MPLLSRPIIFRGGRLTMATSVLPMRSSGWYHLRMPERICRSAPVPSSRVKRSSLSLFFTASQAFTFTARKSDLQKVSKSTCSSSRGSVSMAGVGWAARWSSSAFCSTSSTSSRAKRISGFSVTLLPLGYRPVLSRSSQSRAWVFSWAKIFSAVSGIKGFKRLAPRAMQSTRL